MAKEEKSKQVRSKTLYKFELILLKFIPFILAFVCFLNTVFSYFGIDLEFLAHIGGISLLTLLFLYVSSYVFKFCLYHRLALHYVVVNNILNIYDYYIGVPLDDRNLFILYLVIAFIFLTFILIDYVDNNKKYTESDN